MRIPLLILIAFAAATAIPAHAQTNWEPTTVADRGGSAFPWPDQPRGPHLPTAATPNPQFPLRVWLRMDHIRWDSSNGGYSGYGKFIFANPTSRAYNFDYDCSVTFLKPQTSQFQARWIQANHKLEVLLVDPQKNKEHTCKLRTIAAEPLKGQLFH